MACRGARGLLALLFLLAAAPARGQACVFQALSYSAETAGNLNDFQGEYYDSGEVHNGKPIYVNRNNAEVVWQWGADNHPQAMWDLCYRAGQTSGPASCYQSTDRIGEKQDILPGEVANWCYTYGPACKLTVCECGDPCIPLAPAAAPEPAPACAFQVVSRSPDWLHRFVGEYRDGGDREHGQPVYVNGRDAHVIVQWGPDSQGPSEQNMWDFCYRDGTTGGNPLCEGSNHRQGEKEDLTPGTILNWCDGCDLTMCACGLSVEECLATTTAAPTPAPIAGPSAAPGPLAGAAPASAPSPAAAPATVPAAAATTTTHHAVPTADPTAMAAPAFLSYLDRANEDFEGAIVKALLKGGGTASTAVGGPLNSTTTVVKLAANEANGESVVTVPGTPVAVAIPRAVYAGLATSAGETALASVTLFDPDSLGPAAHVDGEEVRAMIIINIKVVSAAGRFAPNMTQLPEPIHFTLPVNRVPGLACAFWDESGEEWSQEGLGVSERSDPDGRLVCKTSHLTVFGAVWKGFRKTFECSQARLLSWEGIEALKGEEWHLRQGTLAVWVALGFCVLFFFIAACMDRVAYKRGNYWPPSHFLVPTSDTAPGDPTTPQEDMHRVSTASADSTSGRRQPCRRCRRCIMMVLTPVVACGTWCYNCSGAPVREAFDDIMSAWYTYFGEVRSFFEDICKAMDIRSCNSQQRLAAIGQRVMTSMILTSSQRLAGAILWVSTDVIELVLSDSTLANLLVKAHEDKAERDAGHTGAHAMSAEDLMAPHGIWRGNVSRSEAWESLHGEVCHHVVDQVSKQTKRSVARATLGLFVINHPCSAFFVFDCFSSRKMRTFYFIVDFVLTLLMMCFFFEAVGTKRQTGAKSLAGGACTKPSEDVVAHRIGRFLAIALASSLLGSLPVAFLESLRTIGFVKMDYPDCPGWRTKLRAWKNQDRLAYCLGTLFLGSAVFFVHVFLANVSERDHVNFAITFCIMLAQDFFVLPLLFALVLSCSSAGLLSALSRHMKLEKSELLRSVHVSVYQRTNLMLPMMMI